MELTKEEEKELKKLKSMYVYEVSIKNGSDNNSLLFISEEEVDKYIKFVKDKMREEEGKILKDEDISINKRFMILETSALKYAFSNSCYNVLNFINLYKQRKESLGTKRKEEAKKNKPDGPKKKLLYSHFLRKNKKEATKDLLNDDIWKEYQNLPITDDGRCEIKVFSKKDSENDIKEYFEQEKPEKCAVFLHCRNCHGGNTVPALPAFQKGQSENRLH